MTRGAVLVGILLSNLSKEIALMLAHLQPQVTVRPVGLMCVCGVCVSAIVLLYQSNIT